MRILIVEDEKSLADVIGKGLEEEGYAVDVAYNGEDGLFMAENEPSDLIILDWMLPAVDGMTILKTIRKAGVKTPVLLLTARDALPDKVAGLDGGADDYLTKPFLFEELLARIRSLIRRGSGIRSAELVIRDLVIAMDRHEVKRQGRPIPLSAREYALLEFMAVHKNRVLSRTEMTEHLYDYHFDLDSNVIDVFINRLRGKIDSGSDHKLIVTVRGSGYMLSD